MKSMEANKLVLEVALKQVLKNIVAEEIVAGINSAVEKSKTPVDNMLWAAVKDEAVKSAMEAIDGIKL